jgi:putative DNA primase/helicase
MAEEDTGSNFAAKAPPNAIRRSKERKKSQDAQPPNSRAVPESIAKRFVQVDNKYYFPDGVRAFTDRGNRLTTFSENTEVVRSLVGIARARGWDEITVRGTERFRQEAWTAGRAAGLDVRGYRPSELQQAQMNRQAGGPKTPGESEPPGPTGQDTDSISRGGGHKASVPRSARGSNADREGLVLGTLLEQGRAPFQHDPHAAMSYFVKIETEHGARVIWGVDLERAVRESLSKPQVGDQIGLRSLRKDAVTVNTVTRDENGQITREQKLTRHRNRWIVEKKEFFDARAEAARGVRDPTVKPQEAVRRSPELVGTYLTMHAAEIAAKRFRNVQDRALFVAAVRAKLADSLARGEALPAVRLQELAKTRTPDPQEREPGPSR